jgi:hypothetical protein
MSQIDMTHSQCAPSVADMLIPIGCAKTVATLWHALTSSLFDAYKPEKHYMRGPGPKWHQKHRPLITDVADRQRH